MGSYTREQIEPWLKTSGWTEGDINEMFQRLDTPEQSFVEKIKENWFVTFRKRGGALSIAQEWAIEKEAQLIEEMVDGKIEKIEKAVSSLKTEFETLEKDLDRAIQKLANGSKVFQWPRD